MNSGNDVNHMILAMRSELIDVMTFGKRASRSRHTTVPVALIVPVATMERRVSQHNALQFEQFEQFEL